VASVIRLCLSVLVAFLVGIPISSEDAVGNEGKDSWAVAHSRCVAWWLLSLHTSCTRAWRHSVYLLEKNCRKAQCHKELWGITILETLSFLLWISLQFWVNAVTRDAFIYAAIHPHWQGGCCSCWLLWQLIYSSAGKPVLVIGTCNVKWRCALSSFCPISLSSQGILHIPFSTFCLAPATYLPECQLHNWNWRCRHVFVFL